MRSKGEKKMRKVKRKTTERADASEKTGLGFRPLGDRVLVMFSQDDWRMENGLLVKTGLTGAGYRMDGIVVAVGPKVPAEDVGVGATVYADPRVADVVKIGRTRYHLLPLGELMAVAETEKGSEEK